MKHESFPGPKQEYKLSEEAEREVTAQVEAEARTVGDNIRAAGRWKEFENQVKHYPGGQAAFSAAFDAIAAKIEHGIIEAGKSPDRHVSISVPELVELDRNLRENAVPGYGFPVAAAIGGSHHLDYVGIGLGWDSDAHMEISVSRLVSNFARNTFNQNPTRHELGHQSHIEETSHGLDMLRARGEHFAELAALLRPQLDSLPPGKRANEFKIPTPEFFLRMDTDEQMDFAKQAWNLGGIRIFTTGKGGAELTATLGEWPAL